MTETETLAFYRAAYEKSHARAEALEKINDHLYEQEALHTESYGIVCAERDRALNALSDGTLDTKRLDFLAAQVVAMNGDGDESVQAMERGDIAEKHFEALISQGAAPLEAIRSGIDAAMEAPK